MPVQVMPHMYRMLADEIQWALDDVRADISSLHRCPHRSGCSQNEPYNFTHLLIISRIYRLSPEEEAELQGPASRSKRQKQTAQQPPSRGVYPFHPEDEQIQKVRTTIFCLLVLNSSICKIAVHSLDYNFTNTKPREENGFGLDMGGRMMLVPASRLRDLVSALQDAYPPPS